MITKHRVSQRIGSIEPSVTLSIDAKAKELKAKGNPVISFAAGEPDFPTPSYIVDAASQALANPANFRYTAASGLPGLRSAIAKEFSTISNVDYSSNQVLVTNGGKQAVYQACAAIINPGDEVLLASPYWTTYPECVKLAGGKTVVVPSSIESDYKVSVEQLEQARTERTIALIHCSPSNPTGSVYTSEENRAIAKWALDNGIWVISDEIYSKLVYDNIQTESIVCYHKDIAEQSIIISGVAKTYSMTGWRVGWMLGPTDIIKGAMSLQSHLCSNVNNIAQIAAETALTGSQNDAKQMLEKFDERRKLIVERLSKIPGFKVPVPKGAFYVFPDVTELLGKKIAGVSVDSSFDLAELILSKVLVATVPGEAFGSPGHLRFSYALSEEDIITGTERIAKLIG